MKVSEKKIVVISAPSGSGKTTIVKAMAKKFPILSFSVSATTRKPRIGEQDGVDYYFISENEFKKKIETQEFVEHEMVYTGTYYGTLEAELKRIWSLGNIPLLEIDVKGSMQVKERNKEFEILSIFIEPPSMEILEERLLKRGTESKESLELRLKKASFEILYKDQSNFVIKNDDLDKCIAEVSTIIEKFILTKPHSTQ